VSLFPTRLQIKNACVGMIPFESDIDPMIQEMQDRLYDTGVAIGSREELEVNLATERVEWNGYQTIQFSADDYDGLAGVRDNCKPRSEKSWKIRDIEAEHQSPGAGANYFLDHGIKVVGGDKKRVYQVPHDLESSVDKLRFLFKVQSPQITSDSDEVRVRSIYVAKLGLLAIGYQNEGDQRADKAMNDFLSSSSMGQKRVDGIKHRYVGLDTGLRRKPTNRM
jgi:hypothetical protein